MSLDPQSRLMLDQMHAAGVPAMSAGSVEDVRAAMVGAVQAVSQGPADVEVRDLKLPVMNGEIALRELTPPTEPTATVVFVHGGGWVVGGNDAHTPMCRVLAKASGARVVMVDYRVAPEHPFPTPVDDVDSAVAWAASTYSPGPLVIAGDSAGANLAAVAARHAREQDIDLALQLLIYPITDCGQDTPSFRERGEGYLLTARDVDWFWDLYVPDPELRSDPDASPARSDDLAGVAPAHIVVAEYDPLRDQGLEYAERLRESGVPVTVKRHEDQTHGFALFIGVLDAAEVAVNELGRVVREAVGPR